MEFDGVVRIRASPGRVYEVLADIQDWAVHPGSPVEAMEKDPPGTTRVGTRWRGVVRIAPLVTLTMWSEATEVAPDHLLALRFRGGSMQGRLTYTLVEDGPDTVLRQQETMHAVGWLKPFDAFLGRSLQGRLGHRLDEIRDMFTAGGPGPERR